jgi:hypothetical protein
MYDWQKKIIEGFKQGEMQIFFAGRGMGKSVIQQQIMAQQAEAMAREIDREVLWGMLADIGWTRVMLSRLQDNTHAIDITYWLEEHCQGAYERNGRDFLFENTKDATMFTLKWMA